MTLDDVRQAHSELEALGIAISANTIVARIGGSKRDAVRLLRQLRAEEPNPPPTAMQGYKEAFEEEAAADDAVPEEEPALVPAAVVPEPGHGMALVGMTPLGVPVRPRKEKAGGIIVGHAVTEAKAALDQAQAAELALAQRATALHIRQRHMLSELRHLRHTQGRTQDHATRKQFGVQITALQDALATLVGEAEDLAPQQQAACQRLIEAQDVYRRMHTAARQQARA
jgi:hypothetical protein